jgi:hypothetical protein
MKWGGCGAGKLLILSPIELLSSSIDGGLLTCVVDRGPERGSSLLGKYGRNFLRWTTARE